MTGDVKSSKAGFGQRVSAKTFSFYLQNKLNNARQRNTASIVEHCYCKHPVYILLTSLEFIRFYTKRHGHENNITCIAIGKQEIIIKDSPRFETRRLKSLDNFCLFGDHFHL